MSLSTYTAKQNTNNYKLYINNYKLHNRAINTMYDHKIKIKIKIQ